MLNYTGSKDYIEKFFVLEDKAYGMIIDFEYKTYKLDQVDLSSNIVPSSAVGLKTIHVFENLNGVNLGESDEEENARSLVIRNYTKLSKDILGLLIIIDDSIENSSYVSTFDDYKSAYDKVKIYKQQKRESAKLEEEKRKQTEWTLDDVILPKGIKTELKNCVNRMSKIEKCKAIGCYDFDNTILLTGSNGCVDKDTEFFNGTQWKKISEYDNDNVLIYHKDGKATLEKPKEYIKLPCDEMTLMTSPSGKINQCLSDEHRFIYFTKKTNVPHEMTFAEFKQHYENDAVFGGKYVKTAFDYEGEGLDLSDEELRVMVMIIADGYYRRENTNNCILHFKKENKIERAKQLLEDANIEYKTWSKSSGLDISFIAPRKEKTFTQYYYAANKHQMEIILEECLLWDGTVYNNRKIFYTNIKESADYIQFISTSLGHYSSISIYDRIGKQHSDSDYTYKTLEYQVHICKNNKVQILRNENNPKMNFENYKTLDGFKYCFKVSTGMLILRRNNRIFVTGNCGKTAIAKSLCNSADKKYIYQSGASLASKYVGSSAKQVRELFEDARKNKKIIIIDEFESVTRERSSEQDNGEYNSLLTELLTQLDGFEDNSDIIFIAMTNRKDLIDPAILRRFKIQLEIPKPDYDARKEIIALYLNKLNHEEDINIELLAKLTDGVNGSFLRDAVNQSGFRAVDEDREIVTEQDLIITIEHMLENRKTGKEKKERVVGFHS